ncbi:DUF4145 domain-containing protein [Nostoc sp. T09]|uniref:DUF4145 domain-containing protein n=1 Tax=Nostoc sp. T09 TaxID=1932621 RepID=UPI0015C4FE3E|nr:DUF4145 domain-containing protein [Nostoc sp. T09]
MTDKPFRCGHCGNTTVMQKIAVNQYIRTMDKGTPDQYQVEYKWHLLVCCTCEEVNLIEYSIWPDQEKIYIFNDGDEEIYRIEPDEKYLYPSSNDFTHLKEASTILKQTYQEALNCFKSGLYTATVIMCRKTVECLCVIQLEITEPYKLSDKIQRMLDDGCIDKLLYDWSMTLKQFGNIAVHQFKTFTKDEAQDILDFTYALVEYCLDFKYKFAKLKTNRKIKKQSQQSEQEVQLNSLSNSELESLDKMLSDQNELLRYYGAISLAKANVKVEKIVPILIEFYHQNNFKQIKNEIIAFVRNFGSVAVSELIKLLTDSSTTKEIRIMAVSTLGDLGFEAKESIPALFDALADPDVNVQATHALIKIGGEAVSSVIKIYEEKLNSATPTL